MANPPPPRKATKLHERTIDRLIAVETRRKAADFWLELTVAVVLVSLLVPAILIACRGERVLVLVRDVRQGDRIDTKTVSSVRLPRLEHAFSKFEEVDDLVALRDLQGGSVLRNSDVTRPQAVATANISAEELLDAKNIAFKPLPYADDAITPGAVLRKATQFIAAGTMIRTDAVVPIPSPAADVEVPLRAFAGALALAAGDEIMVVATPRGSSGATVFEQVRIVSVDRTRDPATLLVLMTNPEARRFAALPPADFTLIRPRSANP